MRSHLFVTTLKIQNKHYVYAHFRSSKVGVPFYVGKGIKNRAFDFIRRSAYHKRICNKYPVVARILKYFKSKEDAFDYEKKMIAYYKSLGGCEANFHEGGLGGDTFSSLSYSKKLKFRNKMKELIKSRPVKCLRPLRGKDHPNYGKHLNRGFKHSSKFKNTCRKNKLGSKNPMYGRTGAKHPKFKGWYVTPLGIFESAKEANLANNTQYSKYYCKISTSKKFKDWYFITKEGVKCQKLN